MPDSTFGARSIGRDAPAMQLDDKPDISDVYVFAMHGKHGPGAAAAANPVSDSSGIVPDKHGFDAEKGNQTDLAGSVLDISPVSTLLPDAELTLIDSGGQNSDDLDKSPEDEVDELREKLLHDLHLKNFYKINPAASGATRGNDTLVGDKDNDGESDTSIADTLFPLGDSHTDGGFPEGRRFGDDVVDIALVALGIGSDSLPSGERGDGVGMPYDAGGNGFPLGDEPYPIDVYGLYPETKPDPQAGNGVEFDAVDPEYHGDDELIL